MKRLVAAVIAGLALGMLFSGELQAKPSFVDTQDGAEPHGPNHSDCHGKNEVACRPDPQPEHGRDCIRSDDHVCQSTVSTTTIPSSSTTTTTGPTSTTTTTPTTGPTSTPTTPPDSFFGTPEGQTPPCPACFTFAPSTVAPGGPQPTAATTLPVDTSPSTTPPTTELAYTGTNWTRLLTFLGLALVLFGLIPLAIAQFIAYGRKES